MVHRAQFAQWVPVRLERVFLFFANPGNLPRIMPPETRTELLRVTLVPPPGVSAVQSTVTDQTPLAGAGSEIVTSFRILPFLPFRAKWIARIVAFEWNQYFEDVQEKGPFKSFQHRHELAAEERNGVPGTVVRGAWLLLAVFVMAILLHLLHGLYGIGNLVIYAAAAFAIAVGKSN